jgi:hypothetical protein
MKRCKCVFRQKAEILLTGEVKAHNLELAETVNKERK